MYNDVYILVTYQFFIMTIDELMLNLANLRNKLDGDVVVTIKQEDLDIYHAIKNVNVVDVKTIELSIY